MAAKPEIYRVAALILILKDTDNESWEGLERAWGLERNIEVESDTRWSDKVKGKWEMGLDKTMSDNETQIRKRPCRPTHQEEKSVFLGLFSFLLRRETEKLFFTPRCFFASSSDLFLAAGTAGAVAAVPRYFGTVACVVWTPVHGRFLLCFLMARSKLRRKRLSFFVNLRPP